MKSDNADKPCNKCFKHKPLTDYYINRKMKDGHCNNCKVCSKAISAKHREDNLEYIKRRERVYKRSTRAGSPAQTAKALVKLRKLTALTTPSGLTRNPIEPKESVYDRQQSYFHAMKRREDNTAEAQEAARKWQEYLRSEE